MKRTIKNRFTGKIIAEGECESVAELATANRANLSEADLSGAEYGEYVFTGKFIQIIDVSEWGAPFLAYRTESHGLRIMHGCRHFSEAEAVEHWQDRPDRAGTRLALGMAQDWAKLVEGLRK